MKNLLPLDEFKPASIDKSQPGSLHQKKDNTVAVEFQNNQFGKPRVRFEGVSEDYKENDAVLFFNGETFRLERLHRVVKRLRHVRLPGEAAGVAVAGPSIERSSSPPWLASGKSGNVQDVVTGEGQSSEVSPMKNLLSCKIIFRRLMFILNWFLSLCW